MTTHEEIIVDIIETILSYRGDTFPDKTSPYGVVGDPPKFALRYIPKDNDNNVQYSEFFHVEFYCTDDDEVLTVKENMLSFKSDASNGYSIITFSEGDTVTFIENWAYTYNSGTGALGPTGPMVEEGNTILLNESLLYVASFTLSTLYSFDSVNLSLTPYIGSKTYTAGDYLTIKVYGAYSGDLNALTNTTDLGTLLGTGTFTFDGTAWTQNVAQTDTFNIDVSVQTTPSKNFIITIEEGVIGDDGFPFYERGGSFPPILKCYKSLTGSPFWLNVKSLSRKPNSPKFACEFEIEARWDI